MQVKFEKDSLVRFLQKNSILLGDKQKLFKVTNDVKSVFYKDVFDSNSRGVTPDKQRSWKLTKEQKKANLWAARGIYLKRVVNGSITLDSSTNYAVFHDRGSRYSTKNSKSFWNTIMGYKSSGYKVKLRARDIKRANAGRQKKLPARRQMPKSVPKKTSDYLIKSFIKHYGFAS